MLERIKQIEVYNYVGSTVLGSSVVVFIGVVIGGVTVREKIIHVGMVSVGTYVYSMGNYNDVRGRV